jgi:hypothetical protein
VRGQSLDAWEANSKSSYLLPCEAEEEQTVRKSAINSHTTGQRLELGLPSLQSDEKEVSVVLKPFSLYYFVIATGSD